MIKHLLTITLRNMTQTESKEHHIHTLHHGRAAMFQRLPLL